MEEKPFSIDNLDVVDNDIRLEDFVIRRIDELCKVNGLSRYRLGQLTGIAQSSLSTMMNGKTLPSLGTLDRLCEGLGISIFDFFNFDTKKVTVKISTNSKDCDLGHLGRYIETELYKERLDADESKIKDERRFEDKKKAFEDRLRPLPESRRRSHFTGLDSICGTDPTFTGFTVDSTSNLYELDSVKSLMKAYFEDPHKIKKQDFIDEIGVDAYEDILKKKYPADYKKGEQASEIVEDIDEERTASSDIVPNIADQREQLDVPNLEDDHSKNEDLDRE